MMRCKCNYKKSMELIINIRPNGKNPLRVHWCRTCGSLMIERTSTTRWFEVDKPILTEQQVGKLLEE